MRLAVVYDLREEEWPSMELCADMLVERLTAEHAEVVDVAALRSPFRARASAWVPGPPRRATFNADRLVNRFWDYPRFLRRERAAFDLFHVADHSYAQLVHALPRGRAGVFCHDLDTFRCVLEPQRDPRPRWYRAMARVTLAGLKRAAVVFHTTDAVGDELRAHRLVPSARLVKAPLGVAAEFLAPPARPDAELLPLPDAPFLLHVGSCIPRKRVDVVLRVFAALRARLPELRLVKVGGPWAPEQRALIAAHDLEPGIVGLTGIGRPELASLYRRAAVVLQPSSAEGFGLPLVEALACGAIVLASDLPVHREVGGDAVVFAPTGDVGAWTERCEQLLERPTDLAPTPEVRRERAARFTWSRHAQIVLDAYRALR